jgi:hypothetical protein
MRWLLQEPSFLAVVFSVFASAFTFLFQWLLDRGRLDVIYSMPPVIADLALILLYFFGFMTVISFVWFIVVVFKKRKESTSELHAFTSKIDDLIMELKAPKIKRCDEGDKGQNDSPTKIE